jgi:hypothetical protein
MNPPFKESEYFVTRFTSEEGGLISTDLVNSYKKNTPIQVFNNEYMGEFVEEGTGLFKYKSCITDISDIEKRKGEVLKKNERVFAGVD